MNRRCLHITFNERPEVLPRRATTYLPGRSGTDPENPYVMPDPDDPENPYVMPDPDDPENPYVMPDPDDPRYDFPAGGASGAGTSYGATLSTACSCCCAAPAGQSTAVPEGTVTPHPYIRPRDYSGFVIVRTAEGVVSETSKAESLWGLAEEHQPKLAGLRAVLEVAIAAEKASPPAENAARSARSKRIKNPPEPPAGVLVSRPLVELKDSCGELLSRAQCIQVIRALESQTTTTAFRPLHSLAAYWRLDLRERPDLVEDVVARLNRLAEVDLAYRELAATEPQLTHAASGEVFAEDQGYLDDAPMGISASWAWDSLAAADPLPNKLILCDLEQGWNPEHLDLKPPLVDSGIVYGANRAPSEGSSGYHGTAVLGQLAAAGQGTLGVKGAAADFSTFYMVSHYKSKLESHPFAGTGGHVAAAIVQALPKEPPASPGPLGKGDILLLEVQRGLLPTEVDEADLDTIRLASGLGVIVVEAAGNGGYDLDGYTTPETGRSLRRGAASFRDSGAVVVGAARAALPHDRAPFSNYGSRLDCFGWGETVTTCGYGDLAGTGATDFYTNSFNGTSSASPIVVGAAALLQRLYETHTGERLEPRALRTLLSDPAIGTRQGPNVAGYIGIMPDLKAIVRGRLQLVPDVYMRRSIGDDGSLPGPTDDISSSPDIFVWKGTENPVTRFGEGPRANTPAPGTPIDASDPNQIYTNNNDVYVRLRNRGVGKDKAKVQLFASPAATLITPERWTPIGVVEVDPIPQGDILTVSAQPVSWSPPSLQPPFSPSDPLLWPGTVVPAYSFLAVRRPHEALYAGHPYFDPSHGLPPGPPYFEWAEFLAFLRGPGVAWRNIHPIRAGLDLTLAFLLAGTPDRARRFDFEVLQRLPEGAKVTLKMPPALVAKFRQRQPWNLNGSGDLKLPSAPRVAFKRIELSPGCCARAAFHVETTGTSPLLRGHSLAIRQLWRGEEVGRITWFFIS